MIDVHGFNTEGAGTDFDLFVWTVGAADNEGSPLITGPSAATNGEQGQIGISWDGLNSETYLGSVTHSDWHRYTRHHHTRDSQLTSLYFLVAIAVNEMIVDAVPLPACART